MIGSGTDVDELSYLNLHGFKVLISQTAEKIAFNTSQNADDRYVQLLPPGLNDSVYAAQMLEQVLEMVQVGNLDDHIVDSHVVRGGIGIQFNDIGITLAQGVT